MSRKPYGAPLSAETRRGLEKYVKIHGEKEAARSIGVNLGTLLRALAKSNVQAGTTALIERALGAS